MDRPIAVQSPSGMIYPPSVIKHKEPKIEPKRGAIEICGEDNRQRAIKAFNELFNNEEIKEQPRPGDGQGGIVLPRMTDMNKTSETLLLAVAKALLGNDWEPDILC